MNLGPLDELYLRWLYRQFADPEQTRPSRTYWNLARCLYTTEFIWIIPNDDNRVKDGNYLRHEFAEEQGLSDVDPDWMSLGCSFLEMLIALTRRLAFSGDGEPSDWFWELIGNLEIRYSDARVLPMSHIHEVCNTVMYRTYRSNGRGGLFPLRHPRQDQRWVEIWFQLNAYLLEHA